ncbi:MAG: hypothetical protein ABIP48_15645 [Planctomycetota bacterium]
MGENFEKLIWLIVGACVAYVLQRVLAWRNEKRGRIQTFQLAFRGFPDFHKQLFFEGLTPEVWNTQIPPHLRDHCITFVFYLESTGRAVIKDLRVTVDAKNGSGIAAHKFLVERTVICDRLKIEQTEDKRLIADWKYINPGDEIELHLLVAGIDDPNNVEIGVDAEGTDIHERFLMQKSIQAIVCAGQTPMSATPTAACAAEPAVEPERRIGPE